MSATTQVTETDKAWAAGFIDGEGCIALCHRKQKINGKSYECYVLRLSVANTDILALGRLRGMFGGSINKASHRWRPNNKPCWTWYITSAKAEWALIALRPYLFTKATQADVGIASRSYVQRNGRPRPDGSLLPQKQAYEQLRHLKRVV